MRYSMIMTIVVFIALFSACKKDETPVSPESTILNGGIWSTIKAQDSGTVRLPDRGVLRICVDTDNRAIMHSLWGGVTIFDGSEWNTYTGYGYESYWRSRSEFLRDQDGNVWMANDRGIFRNSGNTFLPVEECESFFNSHPSFGPVLNIIQDGNGCIWFQGEQSIIHFDGTRWKNHTSYGGDTNGHCSFIFEDIDGSIVVYQNDGFKKWNGETWEIIEFSPFYEDMSRIEELSIGENGIVMVHDYDEGYFVFKHDQWVRILIDEYGTFADNYRKHTIFTDRDGNRWINLRTKIYMLGVGRHVPQLMKYFPDSEDIYEITQAPDGTIWVASSRGIYIYNGSNWTEISANGFPSNMSNFIEADNNGNIWTYNYNGLYKCHYDEWIEVHHEDNYYMTDMQFDSQNNLWILKRDKIQRLSCEGYWTAYPNIGGDKIFIDKNDDVFIASQEGVLKHVNGSFEMIVDHPASSITSFNGEMLIGANLVLNTDLGIFPYVNNNLNRSQPAVCFEITNFIHDLFVDLDGNLWATSVRGLSKYDGAKWITFTNAETHVDTFTFNPFGEFHSEYQHVDIPMNESLWNWVLDYFNYDIDAMGNIWYSNEESIFVYDGYEFIQLEPDVPIESKIIDVTCMPDGSIWFSTRYDGIVKYIP